VEGPACGSRPERRAADVRSLSRSSSSSRRRTGCSSRTCRPGAAPTKAGLKPARRRSSSGESYLVVATFIVAIDGPRLPQPTTQLGRFRAQAGDRMKLELYSNGTKKSVPRQARPAAGDGCDAGSAFPLRARNARPRPRARLPARAAPVFPAVPPLPCADGARADRPRAADSRGRQELRQEDGGDYDGWFCVARNPFPCRRPGVRFVAES